MNWLMKYIEIYMKYKKLLQVLVQHDRIEFKILSIYFNLKILTRATLVGVFMIWVWVKGFKKALNFMFSDAEI